MTTFLVILLNLVLLFSGDVRALRIADLEVDDILTILIPTLQSDNPKCRNHSIFYADELKNLKLWASEMFDASSKFPSGILFGSSFDFGNFDQCIQVKVPLNDGGDDEYLSGKYCMAKYHITPPSLIKGESQKKDYSSVDSFPYNFYDWGNFINVSTWDKIVAFSDDRSRRTRNDFHFSYCLPSSCTHEDLEMSLQHLTERINYFSTDFKVSASVNPKNCQIKREISFTTPDVAFLSIIGIFVLICMCATFYDWLMKLENLERYKLRGNKHKVLMAFSAWTNLKKLNSKSENDDNLSCIHGIKVISMFLIIMGHRIMFGIGSPIVNPDFIEDLYGRVETMVLLNGPIIVDTFFNISGFLSCYLLLKQFDKQRRSLNVLALYIHRFVRLTPAYAVILGFYCTLFVKLGSGPFWLERVEVEQERCRASWWANLLYLNNYLSTDNICMFQSWYMTCDMHFFLLAPLIVYLLRKKPTMGLSLLFGIVIISLTVVFSVVFMNNEDGIMLLYMKLLRDPVVNNTFKNIYIPTHMRASPYFVGMLTGYLKYKMQQKVYKMPNYMIYLGWIMAVFLIEVTVYSAFIFYIPGKPYNAFIAATYASMHHFTWSICISWMIFAISEGYGGWVDPILSWKPLIPMSRITYTAFLCHAGIQMYSAATIRQATYASIFNLVFQTAGDITLAYVGGLTLSLLFEAPILAMEKIIFRQNMVVNFPREDGVNKMAVVPKIKCEE